MLALTLALTVVAATSAHRRDEYLQAARLAVEVDHVHLELDLTPGIAIVDRLLPEIDVNGDGAIGAGEAQTYSQRVVTSLILDVDGSPLRLEDTQAQFPSVDAMRQGEGVIRISAVAALPDLGTGDHRLHYRNTHRSDIGAYLANALVPSGDRVAITSQERDVGQRDLVIAYRLSLAQAQAGLGWIDVLVGGMFVIVVALVWRRARLGPSRRLAGSGLY